MTAAAFSNKVPVKVKGQPLVEALLAAEGKPEADPHLQTHNLQLDVAACSAEVQEEVLAHNQPPQVINTTLDLLENSDVDLSADPQDPVDDVSNPPHNKLDPLVSK